MNPVTSRRRPDWQRGFSLLEVLVAFAILAISLGVLMQIFAQAARASVAAAHYSRAAAVAESRLQLVGTAIPLEAGVVPGDPEDGFAWEVAIVPVQQLDEIPVDELPLVPYLVEASVLWREGAGARRLTLATLRLGERLP